METIGWSEKCHSELYWWERMEGRCHVSFQRFYFLGSQAFCHGLFTWLCPQKAPCSIVIRRNTLTACSRDRSLNITGNLGQSCRDRAKGWWPEDLTLELAVGCWTDEFTSLHLDFFLFFIFGCAGSLLHSGFSLVVVSGGSSLVAVHGILILVVFHVAKHGLEGLRA